MIVDSNVVIYAIMDENRTLQRFLTKRQPSVSAITYVEVLGYHLLTDRQKHILRGLFADMDILPLDDVVLEAAVALRQQRQMGLGDALIAATALVHRRTLVTRNTADFAWVNGLQLLDPFASDD
jgi:predicted nucleic acid-binding protein